jgi:hypothetical protein
MKLEVRISKHMSTNFPLENGVQRDALTPLLFKFASDYAVRKAWENQAKLKLYQPPYDDDVNVLGDNMQRDS